MKRVVLESNRISPEEFADSVSGLILACLVEVSAANYLISAPIRSLFRRLHGYGSKGLMAAFSATLRDELDRVRRDDELRAELMDALAFTAAIEGGTLPHEFVAVHAARGRQGDVRPRP